MNWYQTYNNFGEMVFRREGWFSTRALNIRLYFESECFWCPPGEHFKGHWVFY